MHMLERNRCNLIALLVFMTAAAALGAPATTPQIGGANCTASMLNGTYFYLLTGTVSTGGPSVPYAELGQLLANGSGGLSGNSSSNLNGLPKTNSLTGSYTMQFNCSGSITITINSQTSEALTFQVINNGQGMILATSNSGQIITGRAYRTSAATGSPACGPGSFSGTYGYSLNGYSTASGVSYLYTESGQVTADGNGNLTLTSVGNQGGAFSNITGTGSYSITSQCSGTASIYFQGSGAKNYAIAIVEDGQQALFFETDSGTTVSGAGQPQIVAPQQAAVNAASFRPGMVAPGGLFSIFGSGFSTQAADAGALPLPKTLGETQVLVNGSAVPLVYVSAGQINAQMPIDVPTGQPVTMVVMNGTAASNRVMLNVPAVAPGIFTSNGKQPLIQNPNGSLNSAAAPAKPGETLIAYLTGAGPVNSGSWTTGAASPSTPASVTTPYTLIFGTEPAVVKYLGLTPGFVGLYQANFTVPTLAPGSYPVTITMAGNSSNTATVVIGG